MAERRRGLARASHTEGCEMIDRWTGHSGVRDLIAAGLLEIGMKCAISAHAVFEPRDELGTLRPIVLADGCVVQAGAVLHGGVRLAARARVEEHVVVGKPELGYAVGRLHPGTGATTLIGAGSVLRSGAVVYAGVRIGDQTVIGHHSLLRSFVATGPARQP